jgi:hypothetical protein
LIGEGNLALVTAFDAFPAGSNVRFEQYARTCIRNAVVRHAVSLISSVDRPWGQRVTSDIICDPGRPGLVGAEESTGCFQYKATTVTVTNNDLEVEESVSSNRRWLRGETSPPRVWRGDIELPPILMARLHGKKLKDIASELGVSIATAHRRVKAAIEEVKYA